MDVARNVTKIISTSEIFSATEETVPGLLFRDGNSEGALKLIFNAKVQRSSRMRKIAYHTKLVCAEGSVPLSHLSSSPLTHSTTAVACLHT